MIITITLLYISNILYDTYLCILYTRVHSAYYNLCVYGVYEITLHSLPVRFFSIASFQYIVLNRVNDFRIQIPRRGSRIRCKVCEINSYYLYVHKNDFLKEIKSMKDYLFLNGHRAQSS